MKLSKKTLAIIGTSATALCLMNTAQAAEPTRSLGEMFTQCGIGAMVFEKNETLAAISNITWDLGTTAVSSGYSSEENCKGTKVAAAAFIHHTYATLEQDIAKGKGQHLSGLMDIMGCDANARSSVIDTVRADFSKAVSAKNYAESSQLEKTEGLYNIMQSSNIKKSCNAS